MSGTKLVNQKYLDSDGHYEYFGYDVIVNHLTHMAITAANRFEYLDNSEGPSKSVYPDIIQWLKNCDGLSMTLPLRNRYPTETSSTREIQEILKDPSEIGIVGDMDYVRHMLDLTRESKDTKIFFVKVLDGKYEYLKELMDIGVLEDIHMDIVGFDEIQSISVRGIKRLSIHHLRRAHAIIDVANADVLEYLRMTSSPEIIYWQLESQGVPGDQGITNTTILNIDALSNIKYLHIDQCNNIEEYSIDRYYEQHGVPNASGLQHWLCPVWRSEYNGFNNLVSMCVLDMMEQCKLNLIYLECVSRRIQFIPNLFRSLKVIHHNQRYESSRINSLASNCTIVSLVDDDRGDGSVVLSNNDILFEDSDHHPRIIMIAAEINCCNELLYNLNRYRESYGTMISITRFDISEDTDDIPCIDHYTYQIDPLLIDEPLDSVVFDIPRAPHYLIRKHHQLHLSRLESQ